MKHKPDKKWKIRSGPFHQRQWEDLRHVLMCNWQEIPFSHCLIWADSETRMRMQEIYLEGHSRKPSEGMWPRLGTRGPPGIRCVHEQVFTVGNRSSVLLETLWVKLWRTSHCCPTEGQGSWDISLLVLPPQWVKCVLWALTPNLWHQTALSKVVTLLARKGYWVWRCRTLQKELLQVSQRSYGEAATSGHASVTSQ